MSEETPKARIVGIAFVEGNKAPNAFAPVLAVDVGYEATVYTLGHKVYRPDGIEGRAFDAAASVYKMVAEWLTKEQP